MTYHWRYEQRDLFCVKFFDEIDIEFVIEGFKERCIRCGEYGAKNRRQFTAYVDDEMNFATLCDICQEEANEYWQERWDEYWGSVL